MGRCCALKCRNRASRGIRLFKLPKSPKRRKLWLSGIKRGAGWKPPDRTYLCEVGKTSGSGLWRSCDDGFDHFEPSQFQTRCSDGWRRLKATAVPNLFLHSESQQPAARTSGAALQGGLLTQPLPTTSGACFVRIFQGPLYPRVAIPPHPSLQVISDNQRGLASAAALDTLVSAASTSWVCVMVLALLGVIS
ncbi:peroxynitrite isomerase THAP4-like [Ixodes scapularis]